MWPLRRSGRSLLPFLSSDLLVLKVEIRVASGRMVCRNVLQTENYPKNQEGK